MLPPPPPPNDHATIIDSAVNPGLGLTPTDLVTRWAGMKSREDVFEFYGHNRKDAGDSACFSNFYDQRMSPFTFRVPQEWCKSELSERERENDI
jgi:hypothetical protein